MAQRSTPAATAAGILPIALAMLPSMLHTPAPTIRPPSSAATRTAPSPETAPGIAQVYPNPDLTPGFANPDITQQNLAQNLCSSSWSTSSIRPPSSYTTSLKKAQMLKYGFTVSDPSGACVANSDHPACYEEDHLVSLENGGNPTDPRNLWPEPYNTRVDSKIMGARQKDEVEAFIHDEICFDVNKEKKTSHFPAKSGITLARGQEILATDWYACYLQMIAGGECK